MFQNREEAGKLLSAILSKYKNNQDAIVLAIPRGGVVVGHKISAELSIPLGIIVVKKLGAPFNPELAVGAVAPSGIQYLDQNIILQNNIGQEYLDEETVRKRKEVEDRIKKYQSSKIKYQIKNKKTFILVDDGIATGSTTLAAIKYLKQQITNNKEQKLILAVPVIAKETYDKIKKEVNKIVALEMPQSFNAVGEFYREFPQVSDEEVLKLL